MSETPHPPPPESWKETNIFQLGFFLLSRSFGFALLADLCEISVQGEKGMFFSSFHSPPPRPVVCSTRGGDSWFSARPTWERHPGWIRRWASPGPPPRTRSSSIWRRNAILLWERNKWNNFRSNYSSSQNFAQLSSGIEILKFRIFWYLYPYEWFHSSLIFRSSKLFRNNWFRKNYAYIFHRNLIDLFTFYIRLSKRNSVLIIRVE